MKVSQCPFMSLSLSFCYETHFALHWKLLQVGTAVAQNHYRDQCDSGQTTQSISRLPCCVFCTYMPVDNDNEVSRNRDYTYTGKKIISRPSHSKNNKKHHNHNDPKMRKVGRNCKEWTTVK